MDIGAPWRRPVACRSGGFAEGSRLNLILNPFVLYALVALGAVGVCLALPRRGVNPQVFGGIIAGTAAGLVILMLGARAVADGAGLVNPFFYVFGIAAIASGLRMVTHPKPVYAALYFTLTILATAGLFLILASEFMAFALVIVYAGAILITYLFVIMLASQSGKESAEEGLAAYDTESREPVISTVACFVLLAALLTLTFRGVKEMGPGANVAQSTSVIDRLPGKAERALIDAGVIASGDKVEVFSGKSQVANVRKADGTVVEVSAASVGSKWPKNLEVENVEGLGFTLLKNHPGIIEIAGVVLLMALLGAVVLSRKQVQFDEDQKVAQSRRLREETARL